MFTASNKGTAFLFLVIFILGWITIYNNLYPTYSLSFLMLVYFLILFKSQKEEVLSSNTLDSPYILGFLFSLVAITDALKMLPKTNDVSVILKFIQTKIGVALITTIYGLIYRHFLLSYDLIREKERKQFLDVAEIMEKASINFNKAHISLITLMEDFTSKHKDLLDEEKDVIEQHITSLSVTMKSLNEMEKNYPPKIESFVKSVDLLQEKLNSYSTSYIDKIHENLSTETDKVSKMLLNQIKSVPIQDINEKILNLQEAIANTNNAINQMNESSVDSLSLLDTTHKDFIKQLMSFKGEIKEIEELITTFISASQKFINKKYR